MKPCTAAAASHDSDLCGSGVSGCSVALGAFSLGVLGAVIGAIASPGERWEKIPALPGGVSVSMAPRRGRGVEARLAIRF